MNTTLPVSNEGQWPIGPYTGETQQLGPGQRNYSAATMLDFAALMRIVHHWRWLVLGAVALGLAGAILATLLTRPVYRAWVTLQANPPTFEVTSQVKDQQIVGGGDSASFVSTQIGLLQSRSVAERAAQELNLANNPDVVPQELDASKRLRAATSLVAAKLNVVTPQQGELIKFSVDSPSPQQADR